MPHRYSASPTAFPARRRRRPGRPSPVRRCPVPRSHTRSGARRYGTKRIGTGGDRTRRPDPCGYGTRSGAAGSAQERPADKRTARRRGAGGKIRFGTGRHICGEARREGRERGNRNSETGDTKFEAPQRSKCPNRTAGTTDLGTGNGLRICRKKRSCPTSLFTLRELRIRKSSRQQDE